MPCDARAGVLTGQFLRQQRGGVWTGAPAPVSGEGGKGGVGGHHRRPLIVGGADGGDKETAIAVRAGPLAAVSAGRRRTAARVHPVVGPRPMRWQGAVVPARLGWRGGRGRRPFVSAVPQARL